MNLEMHNIVTFMVKQTHLVCHPHSIQTNPDIQMNGNDILAPPLERLSLNREVSYVFILQHIVSLPFISLIQKSLHIGEIFVYRYNAISVFTSFLAYPYHHPFQVLAYLVQLLVILIPLLLW